MFGKNLFVVGLVFLVGITFVSATDVESRVYILNLEYDHGDLKLISVEAKIGYPPDRSVQPETGYSAEVLSFNDEILYSFRFDIPYEYFPIFPKEEGEEPQEPIILEGVNFTLVIPYFRDGKEIYLFNPEKERIQTVDVSQFATCNFNGICGTKETFLICPEDCTSGFNDGFCDGENDAICDPDCLIDEDPDCELIVGEIKPKSEGVLEGWTILIASVAIVLIALFYLKKRKSKQ